MFNLKHRPCFLKPKLVMIILQPFSCTLDEYESGFRLMANVPSLHKHGMCCALPYCVIHQ